MPWAERGRRASRRLRPVAVDAGGAAWGAAARLRGGGGDEAARLQRAAALAADVLGAGLAGAPMTVLGPDAEALAAELSGLVGPVGAAAGPEAVPHGSTVIVHSWLEHRRARDAVAALGALRDAPLVVALLPLWPAGRRRARGGLLRSRRWWLERAERAGLGEALELRSPAGRAGCLAFEQRSAVPPAPGRTRGAAAPARREVVVRVHDDLSLGNSFAWISASIALALDDLGVPVSIAPTELSVSTEPDRRERLQTLMERNGSPGRVDAELGWTHFWPQYQRPLGGRVPLALFAINYRFAGRDPDAFDPWLRGLLASPQPLAPISTFCHDVLRDAGVAEERMRIVPMGLTDGLATAGRAPLPGARGLRVLHVTNAADLERNGTRLALDGFAAACAPGDDVTFVVRDYVGYSPELAREAAALRTLGHDVRYWPVFFAPHRLGAFLGAFDLLLAPFRGEGFGIKLLDAMACGVAPACPLFGGPRDFLDESVAFPLDYDLAPVRGGYDQDRLALGNDPLWADCRPDAVAGALRAALDDPAEVGRRGIAARERAFGRFTWRHTAERIVALLEA